MCEAGSDCSKKYQEWESNEEIQLFREYLRIPTVHPNVNYGTGNCMVERERWAVALQRPSD